MICFLPDQNRADHSDFSKAPAFSGRINAGLSALRSRIRPHLPNDTRGKPRADDRRVISGIVSVLKSGSRWIDAPDIYGPHKTLYNRFVRWAAKGVWTNFFIAV